MDEELIKQSKYFNLSPKEDLISVNIILEVNLGTDKTILEIIKMNFNKNIYISDMIKEIIPNFNDSLENHNKKIYLNPESNEYQLCECHESREGGVISYTNGNILEKRTKLQNISSKDLKILYSPKDILLNFTRKKNICDTCLFF